jgi:hypothetical protein
VFQPAQHHLHPVLGPTDQDLHRPVLQVIGVAAQPQLQRLFSGEVAKSNPLHLTPDSYDKRLLSHFSHLPLKKFSPKAIMSATLSSPCRTQCHYERSKIPVG